MTIYYFNVLMVFPPQMYQNNSNYIKYNDGHTNSKLIEIKLSAHMRRHRSVHLMEHEGKVPPLVIN